MPRSIIEQADSALRDLIGRIPQGDRRDAEDDIDTLVRAIALLNEAMAYNRTVMVHAERFAKSIHAATMESYERGLDRV